MNKRNVSFVIQLLAVLFIAGALHYAYFYANRIEIPQSTLIFCYLVNYILALAIYFTLVKLVADENKYVGFVFLVGSAVKFLAYFLIFDPLFKQDGQLSRVEFFLFFTPYLISLVVETIALVKLLRTKH